MKRAHSNNEALERYLVLPDDFKSFSIYCLVEDNNDILLAKLISN